MEDAHEAIISKDQFDAAQAIRAKRQEEFGSAAAFQSKHLLTGLLFCGCCGARYYKRSSGKYNYYACYSRTKQMPKMVKDPSCKNRHWKADELEPYIEGKVRELLRSPKMVEEIAAANKTATVIPVKNVEIGKRVREIDRQISRLMELYQRDDIPTDVLGQNINKLYNEKTALQASLEPVEKVKAPPFDLVQELIADAAQVWDFADEAQKRRIIQNLIRKITLNGDEIEIEWAF